MRSVPGVFLRSAGVAAILLPLAACSIDVNEGGEGRTSDVDIRTPAGNVSVRSDVDARDTGLPVYPGARPARNDNDTRESAHVNVGNARFGVKVVAATFDTDDDPQKVVAFYRDAMKVHGAVTECRGDVDFRGPRHEAVCDGTGSSNEIQLVTGTEERQRVVSIQPRGRGAEFSLVYVETRGSR